MGRLATFHIVHLWSYKNMIIEAWKTWFGEVFFSFFLKFSVTTAPHIGELEFIDIYPKPMVLGQPRKTFEKKTVFFARSARNYDV